MEESGRELLIIAPVGDPLAWQEVNYKIGGKTYTTRCSSIAHTLHSLEQYSSITLLIQALDSLVCSQILGDGGKLGEKLQDDRSKIAETLKNWFEGELRNAAGKAGITCSQNGDSFTVNGRKVVIHVAVAPSAGEYTVMRPNSEVAAIFFHGDPTAVFAKIFNHASSLIEESKERGSVPDICLDLTHGINYTQAMALYAVEVLASLYETNVQIVNFSPLPRRPPPKNPPSAAPSARGSEERPTLVEFDVSSLLQASRLASSISHLFFDESDVKTVREALKQVVGGSGDLYKFCRHVSLALYYMGTGVITYAYYHLQQAKALGKSLASEFEKFLKDEEEFTLDTLEGGGGRLEVSYSKRCDWRSALPVVLRVVFNRLTELLKLGKSISSSSIMKAIEEIAEKKPIYNPLKIVLEGEFNMILRRYSMILRKYSKFKSLVQESKFSMENPVLRTIFLRLSPREIENLSNEVGKKISTSASRNVGQQSESIEELLKIIEDQLREREVGVLRPLSEQKGAEWKRHLISHAGITHEPLKEIEFEFTSGGVRVKLTLDPGKLGDDPFGVWPE